MLWLLKPMNCTAGQVMAPKKLMVGVSFSAGIARSAFSFSGKVF
jgi:hypothetical protein